MFLVCEARASLDNPETDVAVNSDLGMAMREYISDFGLGENGEFDVYEVADQPQRRVQLGFTPRNIPLDNEQVNLV